MVTIPTASVVTGNLERSIRLTGSTTPLNYSTLIVPMMRGGRGNSMGDIQQISSGAGRSRGATGSNANVGRGGGGGPGGGQYQGGNLTVLGLVSSGTRVDKGDMVASFSTEDMQDRVDQFTATAAQRDAGIKRAQTQIDLARQTHDKTISEAMADVQKSQLDLKTTPVLSEIDSETIRLTAEENDAVHKQLLTEVPLLNTSLDAQWKMAQLSQQEAAVELKLAKQNLERMTLRAPLAGLVVVQTTMRNGSQDSIRIGDQVRPGQQVLKVVDTNTMLVDARVNQVNADWIRVGNKSRVRFDAFPDLELPAEVVAINAMPKAAISNTSGQWVKEVPVSLRLLKVDPRVIPDLSVSADVLLSEEPQAILVPRQAIFRDAPSGQPFVYVRQADGWAKREVELGAENFISVAIRSGLKAGEVVACDRAAVEAAMKKSKKQ